MDIGNLARFAPSGHRRALHSLILQYIVMVEELRNYIPDEDVQPYMDLSGKITGFHSIEDKYFQTNPWDRYFIQPQPAPNLLFRMELVGAPYDHSLHIYQKSVEELKIHSNTVKNYLKVRPHILKKVENFIQKHFEGKVVGIHIRGTDSFFDKGRPNLPISYFEKLIENKLTDYGRVFVATDNLFVINRLQEKFKSKIIFYSSTRLDISFEKVALHETIFNEDNIDYGEQVLIESILLSRCDLLIRQQSNVSTYSILLNPNIDVHQFDLPFWEPWHYHSHSPQSLEIRKKNTEKLYYKPNLQVDDIGYYQKEYTKLHTLLTEKEHLAVGKDIRVYIYSKEHLDAIKDYFYNK